MHLVETYSLMSSSKIDKPFILEQYFPLPFEKYITFNSESKFPGKNFDYWQDSINFISPVLESKGIRILQVGGANEAQYSNVIDLRGKTTMSQLAYIIKNAMLHVGPDSFGVHIASTYDVPIVGLYSISPSSVSGPYFGTKSKQILFDAYLRQGNGKASYQPQEHPKSINLIHPEEIANAIFKLLDLNIKVPFETVYVGNKYSSSTIREFIPIKATQIANPEFPIEIRMDLEFNEKVLTEQLSVSKGIILTDKRIDPNLLKQFKSQIVAFVYKITENDDPNIIKEIRNIGFNITLVSSLTQESIDKKKINYYTVGNIEKFFEEKPETIESLKRDIDKLYFKSNKIVLSNDKFYAGNSMRLNNEDLKDEKSLYKAIDCPEFWDELPFKIVYKKI